MSPRQINSSSALASLREETLYTLVRVAADPAASDLAPLVEEVGARVKAAITQEETLNEAELKAQAIADYVQGIVQADIDLFSLDLVRLTHGDRGDPRYMRLFRTSPSHVSRASLDSQMASIQGWPAFLASEPDLASWSALFADHVVKGRAAIEQRNQAVTARRDWRAREREEVFVVVNASRGVLHNTLGLRIREKGKTRIWPDGFFRRGRSATSSSPEAPLPENPPAPTADPAQS